MQISNTLFLLTPCQKIVAISVPYGTFHLNPYRIWDKKRYINAEFLCNFLLKWCLFYYNSKFYTTYCL